MPWVVLLGAGFFLAITGGWRRSLRLWFFATLAAAAATMGLVFCFGGTCGRYMVDFTPALMLLAGVGALAVSARAGGWARTAFGASALVLGFWSGGFGLLASLQHNGLFKAEYPEIYRRVAHAANQPGHLLTKLRGVDFGPVELEVVFPRGVVGRVEPLVVTGRTFLSDYVFVHYLADDLVRFGYEHTGAGGSVGMPIRVVPGAVQKLLIEMGSLYPPEAHPYYKGMPAGLARQRQRTIRVTLNGKVGLYRSAELFDGVALRPDIGTSGRRPAFKQAFSGRILKSGVVAAAAPAAKENEYGAIEVTAMLPVFSGRRSEPLVSSGETGKGNLVFIKYLDERTVVLGYDHWGAGAYESEPVRLEPGVEVKFTVDYGSLHEPGTGPHERIVIRVNDQVVLDKSAGYHPCEPDTVVVGANLIGASSSTPAFSGNLIGQRRVRR